MPSQTLGIGLAAFGSVLLYTGFKNTSVGAAISGKGDSAPSSASQFAKAALGGSVDSAGGKAGTESSPVPSADYARASHVRGVGTFDGKPVALWIIPLLKAARATGVWKGTVQSGYRSEADQARVCATGVKPCAEPGKSHHQFTTFPGGAVDVSDAPGLAAALKKIPGGNLLVWAGSKDPVHFSHPHNGGY